MPHQLPQDGPGCDPSNPDPPQPAAAHHPPPRDLASPQHAVQSRQHHPSHSSSSSLAPPQDNSHNVQKCAKCDLLMQGSFVRALGTTFHLQCFRCLDCDQIVASKFFPITEPNGSQHPLCERDYFRRLNLVCQSCGEALRGSYITALGNKYHIEHFTCSICSTVFGPKDSYYEHDDKVYCHYHYSIYYAARCAGCKTAILKQFVEINRNSQDEHWHPECYMIHKFWNVKLSFTPQGEADPLEQQQSPGAVLTGTQGEGDANHDPLLSPAAAGTHSSRPSMEQTKTPEELKQAQQLMEEKVYQIWTVLSAFEESSAGCISEMLLHVSNGTYYEGVQMAEKFILHVEILFNAIDDLDAQMREVGDVTGLAHGREAKMLCKKIVNFFSLLSHTQESGVRQLGMTQELLSLVTGLAHYLKILIRIALTGALKLERQYHSKTVIARFLSRLMDLANKDKCLQSLHGKGAMDAEVTSDLCLSCRITIEDECFTFDHQNRWHPRCLVCSGCSKPLAPAYYNASFDANRGTLHCQQCRTPESQTGFSHVTKLEQYTFLLRVALIRLENLLHLKGAVGEEVVQGAEQRGRLSATTSTMETGLVPGLVRKDSRSKSHSSDDNRQYETLNLGDIKRVKSTHLDRKLSTSARFPKRQTIIEHQRKPLDGIGESNTVPNGGNAPNDLDFSLLEFEIIDETEFLNDDDELDQPDEQNQDTPATLSDLTQKLRINTSPTASLRMRQVHPSAQGSQHLMNLTGPPKKRQYLSELSALELFIVKHLAVLTLAPIVSDHFTLEELLDLIGQRKQTLWGRFVKGLKTDKKKSKVEGTFGVPLEVLVDRNGVDSALGAGPGRIRIPSFVDDSITAMRNMDMSVEGVFRKNGNIRRLKDLSESIDKDPSSVNLSEDNPVQVAALLKKFLRDLPDPLLTFKLHRLFVVSQKMEDEAVRKTILHLTCCLLPKANRDSMEAICLFLRWVASFSHVDEETGSKMDLHNLATVLTPNVLYSKSKDPIKDESFLAIEAVMGLLSYQEDFCMVPEDVSLILSDQDLVESSMDLSSKDILKRCENLVRTKVKKSHSLGDIYHHEQQWSGQDATGQPGHSKEESAALRAGKAGTLGDVHHPPPPHQSSSREQSVPVMIHRQRQNSQQTNHFQQQQQQQQQLHPLQHSNQHHQQYSQYQQHPHQQQQHHQHQRHQRQHSSGTHGLSMSNPASSASSTLPMRIPERPQAVSVGGGKGATPMSL